MLHGAHSAADYALNFCTVATARGWNEPALLTAYLKGLNEDLQAELACLYDSVIRDTITAALKDTKSSRVQPIRHDWQSKRGRCPLVHHLTLG